MKRRRRRLFREDVIAPWAAMGVIVVFWWLSALVIGRGANPATRASGASLPVSATAERSAADATTDPPPTARAAAAPADVARAARDTQPLTIGEDIVDDVRALRQKELLVPVNGLKASSLHSTFGDPRGPTRAHEALDILAPRGTPVVAATEGRIVKLFNSARGGLTVYQFDVEERYCYYYAHLDGYASDLKEGDVVRKGQTLGYVGTTGNAPPGTPHLHFAINRLGPDKHGWEGEPIDPYLAFVDR
jgi:murein DD-endopeptidase MepM/ murein hydrolase activator NlpD